MTSPKNIGITDAQEGFNQTPISEWRVSDDEEDSVPISQLLVADKQKVRGHRKDNSEWGKRMERELGQIEKRQQRRLQQTQAQPKLYLSYLVSVIITTVV